MRVTTITRRVAAALALPPGSAREQAPARGPRLGGDEHDIEITDDAAVLKGVVQHRDGGTRGGGVPYPSDAPGRGEQRDPRVQLPVQQHLVLTVATDHDRRPLSPPRKPLHQPGGERRLPCPTHADVADADNRYRSHLGRQPATIVAEIARANRAAVEQLRRRQRNVSHAPPRATVAAPPASDPGVEPRATLRHRRLHRRNASTHRACARPRRSRWSQPPLPSRCAGSGAAHHNAAGPG